MKFKTIQLASKPELTPIDEMWAFSARITFDVLASWCLALTLLKEKLIDSIIVAGLDSKTAFTLAFAADNEKLISAVSTEKGLAIKLGRNAVEFLTHFYLTYYRDGQADVNHVDLETTFNGKEIYLTFYAEHSKPPLTSDEAATLLGTK